MMKGRIRLCLALAVATVFTVSGAVAREMPELKSGGAGGFSFFESDGKTSTVFTLSPEFGLGSFKAGLDINIFSPAENRPDRVPVVGIRFVEYDDGTNGIRYGVLSGIKLGYGLIMDGYSTEVSGTTIFDPKQAGVKAYTNMLSPFSVMLMGTNSQVYAERITYTADNIQLFGIPVILGQSYAIDMDGVNVGGATVGKGQSAVAVDAGWPVFGSLGTFFAEAAQLSNYSSGVMSGFTGQIFGFLDYQFDVRSFGSQFIPGYFNYEYEVAPYNLKTLNNGRITGYHGGIGFNLGTVAYFAADYTDYSYENSNDNDPSLKAELLFNGVNGVSGRIRYEQPEMESLSSATDTGATIVGDVFVPPTYFGYNMPGYIKITYKGYYDSNGDYQKSQEFGYRLSF